MIENFIKKVTSPIFVIVLFVVAVLSVVAYAITNNMAVKDASVAAELPVNIVRSSTTDEIVIEKIDVEANMKEEYEKLKEQYSNLCNPQKVVTEKAEKYIMLRYNSSEGFSKDADVFKEQTKDLVTDYFKETLETGLKKSNDKSVCTVKNAYQNGRNLKNITSQTEVVTVYVTSDLNDREVCHKVDFLKINGEWLINDVKLIGAV